MSQSGKGVVNTGPATTAVRTWCFASYNNSVVVEEGKGVVRCGAMLLGSDGRLLVGGWRRRRRLKTMLVETNMEIETFQVGGMP